MIIEFKFTVPQDELPQSMFDRWPDVAEAISTDSDADAIIIEIEAEYTPYCPGRYDGPPGDCYPAEEASAEIESVTTHVLSGVDQIDENGDEATSLFPEDFVAHLHQYAEELLECERDEILEKLLDKGKNLHGDEMSALLADVEAEVERRRERAIDDVLDGHAADMEAADWAARRTSGGDR